MAKLTKEELLKLKKGYKAELERQRLQREVEDMRRKAHPGVFEKAGAMLTSVFSTLNQNELDKDAKKGRTKK